MAKSNGKLKNQDLERWQKENFTGAHGLLKHKIEAKTVNQGFLLDSLRSKIISIVYGPAGTGKSMCAIGVAAEKYASGEIEKILVCRSMVDCGRQMPALPGDLADKTKYYMASYIEYLEYFLGKQEVYKGLVGETILLRPIEMIRGHTYKNTFMIADEAQNLTPKQIKMFMSRIGEGSKIALLGDYKQSDQKENGLEFCVDYMRDSRHLGLIKLEKEDILRHPIIAEILDTFDEQGV